MNPKIKKFIAVFIFIIIFGIFLRLLEIPFYIFRDTKWESLVIILILLGSLFAAIITYKITRYIHKNL